jgi:site-specific DNA-cytosine methylase
MRHLSLFAGSGIGSLAAQAAGIVTVAHAENDPACCYLDCMEPRRNVKCERPERCNRPSHSHHNLL